MRNLFEMIFEYQLLRGKDQLVPLDDDERVRLYGLAQLLQGERSDAQRQMPRLPYPTGVQFTMPGGFGVGAVKNLSGLGIAIATRKPLSVGARTVVRVEENGTEYFFPCRVCWSRKEHSLGMGLAFDGVPTRATLFGDEDSSGIRWQSMGLRAMRLGTEMVKTEPKVA
ncbi:MAG: PilZ domain-containing protein [Deltaproteobacteria bacterium]|nr:PilZ domain-containing protein [Deltaproteobacteria bacterium]